MDQIETRNYRSGWFEMNFIPLCFNLTFATRRRIMWIIFIRRPAGVILSQQAAGFRLNCMVANLQNLPVEASPSLLVISCQINVFA